MTAAAQPLGTAEAFPFEQYRRGLTGHCYRMLGSVVDAEDAVQEAMLRAWRAAGGYREQASPRTWLYRIATNVCLDALAAAGRRRERPVDAADGPNVLAGDSASGFQRTLHPHERWVEPVPDALALPAAEDEGPEQRAILRESIQLAFVAALQYLPPRQRAVLLLREVLNWSAAEAAEGLGMTVAGVNSALQRARATLAVRNPAVVPRALSPEQQQLVARYVSAFEAYDVAALTALLHEEATLSMPPYAFWLRGRADIAAWLVGPGAGCRGSRVAPVGACGGQPAFAQWRRDAAGGYAAWALVVLDVGPDRVTGMTSFLDVATLFPRFGLPLRLPA